jgi:hypothetical protein
VRLLGDKSDFSPQLLRVLMGKIGSGPGNTPMTGGVEPIQEAQEAGLTATGRADQGGDPARGDATVNLVE